MTSSGSSICFAVLIVLIFNGNVINSSPSVAIRGAYEDPRAGQPILEERSSYEDLRAGQPVLAGRSHEDQHNNRPILKERFSYEDLRAGQPVLFGRSHEDQHNRRPILQERSPAADQQVRDVDDVELRELIETPMRELLAERTLHTVERSSIGNGRGSEAISKRMDDDAVEYCEQMAKKTHGCSYSDLK